MKIVFKCLKSSKDKTRLSKEDANIPIEHEGTLGSLSVITGDNRYISLLEKAKEEGKKAFPLEKRNLQNWKKCLLIRE